MSISEAQSAFGSWTVRLRGEPEPASGRKPLPGTPQEILDLFDDDGFFGHVIITPRWVDPSEVDPLTLSRYTGVYRGKIFTETNKEISGSGLVFWLGDLENHGPIYETPEVVDNESFVDGINQLLPDAIQAGTIHSQAGTQTASYLFITARRAIEDWCSLFGCEYEITPQGEMNAGTKEQLYPTVTNPTTLVKAKGASGADPNFQPLPLSNATLGTDAINYATRVIGLVQIEDESFLEGDADLSPPTAYRDLHGNLVAITDVNVEQGIDAGNVSARAAARLAQISEPRNTVSLSTADYDVDGTMKVGDMVYVWNPEAGFVDMTNQADFRGETYFPAKLRVVGLTWPITKGMGVYFRRNTAAGETYDLTPYVEFESNSSTQVEVGAFSRSLIPESTGPLGPITGPVQNDDDVSPAVPDAPTVVGNVLNVQVVHDLGTGGTPFTLPQDMDHLEVHISTTSGFTPDGTSYRGGIPANKGHINAGASVVATFEVPSDTQRYVRVIAVDKAGNLSPASAQTPVQAGLIDTAHITNLAVTDAKIGSASISKLTTGSMTASTFTLASAGLMRAGQTSSPFNYWEADEEGIRAFINGSSAYTGGTSTFEFDVATGDAYFSGDIDGSTITGGTIQTASSGQRVVLVSTSQASVFFETGDAAQSLTGSIRSHVEGSGATRRLFTIVRSPTVLNDTNQIGVLQLWSDQQNGAATARAILKVSTNGSSSDPGLTGAMVSVTGVSVDVAADSGDYIRVETDRHSLVNGGVTSLLVQSHQVVCLTDMKLSGNPIYLTGSSGTNIQSYNDGEARWRASNVKFRIGGFLDGADMTDNAETSAQDFTAILHDVSDFDLKEILGQAPAISENRGHVRAAAQSLSMGRFKGKSGPMQLMVNAQVLPEWVKAPVKLRESVPLPPEPVDGTDRERRAWQQEVEQVVSTAPARTYSGFANASAHAWHVLSIDDLYGRCEALQRSLDRVTALPSIAAHLKRDL